MNIKEILIGIAIGDSFGAGVEFQDRDWIRKNVDYSKFINAREQIKVPREEIKLFTENYKEWDYTDDTEMTIGLLKSLMSKEEFTTELLIRKWKEEYEKGIKEKGYGRNGHGSMRWFFLGEKTISEIRSFQRNRSNPGNAPAMRSVPIGLIEEDLINDYAEINAKATHPNINAIISSQCIARASEYLIIRNGNQEEIISYCKEKVTLNKEYKEYLDKVDQLGNYEDLSRVDFNILCGKQPIEKPYFLSGIKGVPSDSKYTTGSVLYILKNCKNAMDALKKSINLGGDVDSIASITTGIMAGKNGLSGIPEFMKINVEGLDYIEQLAKDYNERFKKEKSST